MKSILLVYHGGQFRDLVPDVKKIVGSYGIDIVVKERDCMTNKCHKGHDMILVIGGDGTFLRASHHNKMLPMFGINPKPKRKEGFYMQATIKNYLPKLKKVLDNGFKTTKYLRLLININGKNISKLALNDVFIGDVKPYNMFNYELKIGNKSEFQRGSGLIIGTPTGSHAWLKSAGAKVMKFDDKKFQYFARELYERRLTSNYKLKKGILSDKQTFELTCKSPGILVIDSISQEFKLARESNVKINVSKDYLDYIVL